MNDDYVGYGHPPRAYQFKTGQSGNKKGRPKKPKLSADDIIRKVLGKTVVYQENGRERSATWQELNVRRTIQSAIGGDVTAAKALLRLLTHAEKYGEPGVEHIYVEDWLPDHPQQTGEQKNVLANDSKEATTASWWPSTTPDTKL